MQGRMRDEGRAEGVEGERRGETGQCSHTINQYLSPGNHECNHKGEEHF